MSPDEFTIEEQEQLLIAAYFGTGDMDVIEHSFEDKNPKWLQRWKIKESESDVGATDFQGWE